MPSLQRTRRPALEQPGLGLDFGTDTPHTIDFDAAARATAATVRTDFVDPDYELWLNSPYAWIRQLPAASRSRAAETIVRELLTQAGFTTHVRDSSTYDIRVDDLRIKVKLSTRWASGEYKFQQLRDGDYDLIVLLGVSPDALHLWAVPKADILTASENKQWLTFPVAEPPAWLSSHGGHGRSALIALDAVLERRRR